MEAETISEDQLAFENDLQSIIQSAFVPNDTRPIHIWAGDHVTLESGYAITGKFDCSISPHFRKIFEAFQDPFVREVNILAPPRSGKTLVAELCFLHTIANSSGDILWLQETSDKAEDMSNDRMIPLLKSCKPVADLIDEDSKYNITDGKYKFLHSTVTVTSPKPSTLNAKGYRFVFADECWTYKGDAIIQKIKRRMDDYAGVNKAMFFSQGGDKDSAWHSQFNSGEVYEYGWTCPKCSTLQVFEWNKKHEDGNYAGIYWPNDSTTKDANGRWIIRECAKQAVLKCRHCEHQVTDTGENRRHLIDNGDYVRTNPNADVDSTIKSFRYTNLIKKSFAELVTTYLVAKQQESCGFRELFIDWTTTEMADFWDEYLKNKRIAIRLENYDTVKPFGDFEARRFLTVDVQLKSFYYICRAWTANGESRLISHGTANTWNDIENIRERNKVEYRDVYADTGNDTEINLSECLKRGRFYNFDNEEIWCCYNSLKGSGLPSFQHKDKKLYRYHEAEEYPATNEEDLGKSVMHVTFSSFAYSRILELLRDGKGKKWEAADITQEYTEHLNSTFKQQNFKTGKWEYGKTNKNVPDHYWDCEKMQLVAADINNLLAVGEPTAQPTVEDDKSILVEAN